MMKHKERIRKILKENPASRNDDKLLTYLVFQEIAKENGQAVFIPFNLFSKFPAFETVKRTRAFIQNVDNDFLPEGDYIIKKDNITKGRAQTVSEKVDRIAKTIFEVPNSKFRNNNLI